MPTTAAGALRRRPQRVRAAILDWHAREGRLLAFRRTADPWSILVAEVMAQQTRIDRVEAALPGFLERFPSVVSMAVASPADVLRAWAGLGYNRRAIALQRAATELVDHHEGRVPDDLAALEALPGVGPYTARAVLAQAFGARVAAVDVNVRRVVTRLAWGASASPGPGAVQAMADHLVPAGRAAEWTHALMDLGATLCRARAPRCAECPVAAWCAALLWPADPGASAGPAQRRPPSIRFEATTRWLRGRIVDDLRVAPAGRWTTITGPIGTHDQRAVVTAIEGLVADGLIERAADGRTRLPSRVPVAR